MPRGIRRLRRVARDEGGTGSAELAGLIDALPPDARARALTHSSWAQNRSDSYGRLAFLGDSVLGLAIAEHLHSRFGQAGIGRLTKIHGQAVSGRACAAVAIELGLPDRLRDAAPDPHEGGIDIATLVASERALASLSEALIGACYLHHGFEATARAIVAAFSDEIELASDTMLDFKSALQERLAREGARVRYEVIREVGPAHDRRFEVGASVDGEVVGRGSGRNKKAAEQAAAAEALERLRGDEPR